jgi:hypothetical protein
MKRAFPRQESDESPTGGDLDELLPEDASVPAEGGSLRGYAEGSRVRRRIYGVLIIGTVVAVIGGQLYVHYLDHKEHNPVPRYELAPGTTEEVRPNTIEWTSGFARLGLSRTEPAIEAIILPDRILRLAEGSDHAQVKVNVVDGRTVELKIITGEIVSEPRTP